MIVGAEEGTRTPTPLRVRGPEPRASANSATSARLCVQRGLLSKAAILSLANAGTGVKSSAICVNRGFAPRYPQRALPCANLDLNQFGVEHDLGVVGEQLGDGAAGLGVGGGFVEDFLGGAGNAGGCRQRNPGDGEARIGLGEGDGCVGFNPGGGQARAAQLRAQCH